MHASSAARIAVIGLVRMRAERILAQIPSFDPSLRLDDALSVEHKYFQINEIPAGRLVDYKPFAVFVNRFLFEDSTLIHRRFLALFLADV